MRTLICLCVVLSVVSTATADDAHENSLFQLQSVWTNQDGEDVRLDDVAGRISVVAMGYTSCHYSCPLTIAALQRFLASLRPEVRQHAHVIFVSFDSELDTPERFRKLMLERDLKVPQWTFLRGSADDILELAVVLGIRFKRSPGGGFSHSNELTLLDSQGRIAAKHVGFEKGIEAFAAQAEALATTVSVVSSSADRK